MPLQVSRKNKQPCKPHPTSSGRKRRQPAKLDPIDNGVDVVERPASGNESVDSVSDSHTVGDAIDGGASDQDVICVEGAQEHGRDVERPNAADDGDDSGEDDHNSERAWDHAHELDMWASSGSDADSFHDFDAHRKATSAVEDEGDGAADEGKGAVDAPPLLDVVCDGDANALDTAPTYGGDDGPHEGGDGGEDEPLDGGDGGGDEPPDVPRPAFGVRPIRPIRYIMVVCITKCFPLAAFD